MRSGRVEGICQSERDRVTSKGRDGARVMEGRDGERARKTAT